MRKFRTEVSKCNFPLFYPHLIVILQIKTTMKYFEFTFDTNPCTETVNDVLAAVLGDAGFESFIEREGGLSAYIQQSLCNEEVIKNALNEFPLPDTEITYNYVEAEDKNWNEEWEKNFFQPIVIGNRCVIHSTFHHDVPKAEYDIVINPQMAFGTGHHETTSLIISELLNSELEGKSLLDMGCGTSILAILARMRGATPCTAIDIDEWCVRNSIENIELNKVTDIDVELGDAGTLQGKGPFDVVIANMMLYHVPDIDKGLAEVQRVLKRGGLFYCATYGEHGIVEYLSKILSAYGVEDNINKNFTLQNGYEILSKTFSRVEKLEYIDSLAVTNIDDMVEYIYSLSSMTSLNSVPKQVIKEILINNTTNGILNVPKEYGMFISS